jgi:hypothetical protein
MAEADNKTTTSPRLTLAQAAELIGREELQSALEEGRLRATTDSETWALCDELRLNFGFYRPPQADHEAVDAIRRRAAIPKKSWWRWFADDSVNWQTGEVTRWLPYRKVIRPLLQRGAVLEQFPADRPVSIAVEQAPPKKPASTKSREQRSVQEIVTEKFPGGYEKVSTKELYKKVTDEQKRRKLSVSKRDTVSRAVGRRKG